MINNTRAGCWLLTDMCLHTIALSLVKAMGADYPVMQMVFIRAAVGLVLLLPWLFRGYRSLLSLTHWQLHAARILCSVLALSCGYYALGRVPLALFSALNYLRPAVLMIMATLVLGELVTRRRWLAVGLGFIGVLIALQPGSTPLSSGTLVLFLGIAFGTVATILLRRLKGTSEIVMMLLYTGGLALVSAPFALILWVPVSRSDIFALAAIGLFSQCAQYCFLKAHWLGDVGFLGPLTYLNLLLAALAGYVFFNEIPSASLATGALIIVISAALLRELKGTATSRNSQ